MGDSITFPAEKPRLRGLSHGFAHIVSTVLFSNVLVGCATSTHRCRCVIPNIRLHIIKQHKTQNSHGDFSPQLLPFCVRSLLRVFLFADFSDSLHDIVAELAAGAAVLAACDFELFVLIHTDVERSFEKIGLLLLADVGEQHDARSEH